MNNVKNNGLKPGALLRHDTYRIERILGQGGFGITYLATDLSLERYVAIKEFFPKDYCDREESTSHITIGTSSNVELVSRLKAKFLKEARNIAKFDHSGIIKIHTAFEENNTAYYVMDYIEGCNLNEIVKSSGPLSEFKAVNYITQVGDALDYIHKHNVNHLDIKPANIMIRRSDDHPILIDFGLSKQYDSEGNQTSTTPTGISHGYAALEQYNLGGVSEFSPQTDIYSLGATLLFLISGKTPPTPSEIIEDGLTLPSDIENHVKEFISKCMIVSRSKRITSITEATKLLPRSAENKSRTLSNQVEGKREEESESASHKAEFDAKISQLNEERTILLSKISDHKKTTSELKDEIAKSENKCEELRKDFEELTKKNQELSQKNQDVQATCESLQQTTNEKEEQVSSLKAGRNIFSGLFIITLIGLICSISTCSGNNNELLEAKESVSNLDKKIASLNSQLSSKESEIKMQKNLINTIAGSQSVFVESIEVKNNGESYGAKINSKNTTFITPRIKVINLSNASKTLGIKFYAPYGLSTGDISKNGFSYTEELPANYSGWFEIAGWGSDEKGHWFPGNYRIEIWSDGKCISKHPFKVH